jgi:glutathione synthase/RimK-type ligase-like ATP-grasp enzyme
VGLQRRQPAVMADRLRIALAGCARFPGGHDDDSGLLEALRDLRADGSWETWDDPAVDWSAYDVVAIRQTWDYPDKLDAFLAWLYEVETTSRLVNPAPVVRWNHHKSYLLDLAQRGVPVVPTLVTRGGARPDVAWTDVVAKPAVGVGGDGAARLTNPSSALADHLHELLALGDVLVQPYLPAVESHGETSVIMLGGALSHGVRKRPAQGEFRVHEHRGGSYELMEPTAEQRAAATAALGAAEAATGSVITFARADLIDGPDGGPLLIELELIEPSLYLHHAPGGAVRLAEALVAAAADR